jgi:lysophospholipase L1-like esterase
MVSIPTLIGKGRDDPERPGLYQNDRLHLKPKAYEIWAKPMDPVIKGMLK